MRSRLVVLISVAMALAAVTVSVVHVISAASSGRTAVAHLKPNPRSYLGVFEPGSPPDFQPIVTFARAAGRLPDIVGYYSGWAEPFNTSFASAIYQHKIIPYVQIDPTDATVAAIAAGTYDTYLRTYADSVADFGHAVIIGFGHEMNSTRYAWGYGHVSAATFIAAWRHIVTVFNSEGADNVTWLWTLEADGADTGPIMSWWPGRRYVTWIGIDGYYYRPSDTFTSVFGKTINQVRSFTSKPVLLSETAVGPDAGQFLKIQNLFRGMATYKTLGLVWFDISQHGSIYHQDWRIEDHFLAWASFRLGVRDDLSPVDPPQHS